MKDRNADARPEASAGEAALKVRAAGLAIVHSTPVAGIAPSHYGRALGSPSPTTTSRSRGSSTRACTASASARCRASTPGPLEFRRGQTLTAAGLIVRLNDLGYAERGGRADAGRILRRSARSSSLAPRGGDWPARRSRDLPRAASATAPRPARAAPTADRDSRWSTRAGPTRHASTRRC